MFTMISDRLANHADRFGCWGRCIAHYGLVIVLLWIGLMKFTAYEAMAIEGLIKSSPWMAWLYSFFDVQMTSNIIGVIEVVTALLLLSRKMMPAMAGIGACMAAFTFLLTSSFLLTAPNWEMSLGGFPAINVLPGQFLLKDLVLLGTSLWIASECFKEAKGSGS